MIVVRKILREEEEEREEEGEKTRMGSEEENVTEP